MKRTQRRVLDLAGIVHAALGLLDEAGLDELSMRRLADALGVQNPALYWHVQNKQALLDHMAQALLVEGFLSVEDGSAKQRSWARRLERFAHALRGAMRSRKDGARLIAAANLSQPGGALIIRIEALVNSLVAEGFRASDALWGVLTLIHYTLGATLEEQSDPRHGDPGPLPEVSPAMRQMLAEMQMPESGGPSRVDMRFEFGVALIVEGLRARKRSRQGRQRGRRPK
ncbi:TetR/AcrR family transcriptional regulator C-terminal domain-containing protein [Bradyrhizobium roseum]|uniref:TetR/AcrR family transcriptional regulator C-terminal domain-containing protein n=1 Tax=Bradyrhizobium roseum TaxID=3056648 RepID=UPI002607BE39|nr:TetR/AcrR family transcriptional regulator C-terminal domain-containing protein [Bradyrhizobium roseus]WKA29526.1 TetR/AcrR family transcriptional regulator C-terminal domain-containing protein [Bradyrhizobium roseus]